MKEHNAFVLTLICIVGTISLAFSRPGTETAVLTTLPVILGAYIGARSAEKIMAVREAARDPNCDTHETIKTLVK
jgi:uncharacterized membrane protein YfcA